MNKDNIKHLPKLQAGNAVTIPSPKDFTFNPNAVNPAAVSNTRTSFAPVDTRGLIQVSQFNDNLALQREKMQADMLDDLRRQELAEGREQDRMSDKMIKNYLPASKDLIKNSGLDRRWKRDNELINEIETAKNKAATEMYQAIQKSGDPNSVATQNELAEIAERFRDVLGSDEVIKQVGYNKQAALAQQSILRGGQKFSSARYAKNALPELTAYKNGLKDELDEDLMMLDKYLDQTDSGKELINSTLSGTIAGLRKEVPTTINGFEYLVETQRALTDKEAIALNESISKIYQSNPDLLKSGFGKYTTDFTGKDYTDYISNFTATAVAAAGLEYQDTSGGKKITGGGAGYTPPNLDNMTTKDFVNDILVIAGGGGRDLSPIVNEIDRLVSSGEETRESIHKNNDLRDELSKLAVTKKDPNAAVIDKKTGKTLTKAQKKERERKESLPSVYSYSQYTTSREGEGNDATDLDTDTFSQKGKDYLVTNNQDLIDELINNGHKATSSSSVGGERDGNDINGDVGTRLKEEGNLDFSLPAYQVFEVTGSLSDSAGTSTTSIPDLFNSSKYPNIVEQESGFNGGVRSSIWTDRDGNIVEANTPGATREESWGSFQFNLPKGNLGKFLNSSKKDFPFEGSMKSVSDINKHFDKYGEDQDFINKQEEFFEKETVTPAIKKLNESKTLHDPGATSEQMENIAEIVAGTANQFGQTGYSSILKAMPKGLSYADFINKITDLKINKFPQTKGRFETERAIYLQSAGTATPGATATPATPAPATSGAPGAPATSDYEATSKTLTLEEKKKKYGKNK